MENLIGHNQGSNSSVKDRLQSDYEALAQSVEKIAENANQAPKEVTDDAVLGHVSDLVKEVAGTIKRVESARVAEKDPYLQAGRDVDAFFKAMSDRLGEIKKSMESRASIYLKAKAEAERKQREEEARKLAEEAERKLREAAEAEAANGNGETQLIDAIQTENAANAAAVSAMAKSSDLARTRSESGVSMATLTEFWDYEIQMQDKIPLWVYQNYLPQDAVEKAIKAAIKDGVREIEGVRIFKNSRTSIR